MTDLSFITNVVTSLFCAAVLVQTVRLSRAVHLLRHAGLIEVVATLEAATETSQQALAELSRVLTAEGPPLDTAVRGARDLRAQLVTLRDELSLMIDIGNGVAERILAAANRARPTRATAAGEVAAEEAVVEETVTEAIAVEETAVEETAVEETAADVVAADGQPVEGTAGPSQRPRAAPGQKPRHDIAPPSDQHNSLHSQAKHARLKRVERVAIPAGSPAKEPQT